MNATPEEWRPVVGWEGLYEVSDQGRVRSLDRIIHRKDGVLRPLTGRVLKPHRMKQGGYMQIALPAEGSRQVKSQVQWLVLEAFVGPRPLKRQSCHRDGNPANNALTNLYWGTVSENARDRVRHGTHPQASKTQCKWGHEFTPENTRWDVRRGRTRAYRACRACAKKQGLRRRAASSPQ